MKTPDGGTLVPVMTNWEVFYGYSRGLGQCQAHSTAMANAATGESRTLTHEEDQAIARKFVAVIEEVKKARETVQCNCGQDDNCHSGN